MLFSVKKIVSTNESMWKMKQACTQTVRFSETQTLLFKDFWVKGTTSKTFLILRRLWRWRWAIAGDRGWEREALPGMRNRPGMR